jgi:hypothetical protein
MAPKQQLLLTFLLLLVLTAGVCPAAQASRSRIATSSVNIRAVSSHDSGKSLTNSISLLFDVRAEVLS